MKDALKQLGLENMIPDCSPDGKKHWDFSKKLKNAGQSANPHQFFSIAIQEQDVLKLQYQASCRQLNHRAHLQDQETLKLLIENLMMAEFLAYLYKHYLAVPREAENFNKHRKFYQDALANYYEFGRIKTSERDFFMERLRKIHLWLINYTRLTLLRTKSIMDASMRIKGTSQLLIKGMTGLNSKDGFQIFLSCQSWVSFIPRFLANSYVMAQHLIVNGFMREKEKQIEIEMRLKGQFLRRGFEMTNDSMWILAGLLGQFVWKGGLKFIKPYSNLYFIATDVVIAVTRYAMETNRLNNVRLQYDPRMLVDKNAASRQLLDDYILQLETLISYEKKRVLLSVFNNSAILLSTILGLPFFGATIILAGAIMSVIFTVGFFIANECLKSQKPDSDPSALPLLKPGLFSSDTELRSEATSSNDYALVSLD